MGDSELSAADLAQLADQGIAREELRRQLELFREPPAPSRLLRPCTIGDGIVRLPADEHPPLLKAWERAAASGRLIKFVPASGAATRMFKNLLTVISEDPVPPLERLRKRAAEGDVMAQDVLEVIDNLDRFAFASTLKTATAKRGHGDTEDGAAYDRMLDALLSPAGLGYSELPKGLLAFHRSPEGPRTPFEEHLVEAALFAKSADGCCRVHFTVSLEHESRFVERFREIRGRLQQSLNAVFEVEFSHQAPETDTIAVDLEDRPFRGGGGRLLFRPGGHGALIRNLGELSADIILVKNIDNILPDERKSTAVLWKQLLTGYLVTLQERVYEHLERIDQRNPPEAVVNAAAEFACNELRVVAARELDRAGSAVRARMLTERLDRPLRVCGVVRNLGEPGGGPFWVAADGEGESRQIVESPEVELSNDEQSRIWSSSTHFNPVDLVCAVRNRHGQAYDLDKFVDPRKVFISRKSSDGRELKALERPGLWNGAMAHWTTVFVEVPIETFAPVKTLLDLLRPEHQADATD